MHPTKPVAAGSTTHHASAPRYLGSVTSERIFNGDEILPPGDAHPRLTWEQAYSACQRYTSGATCDPGGPLISLARVTTTGSGHARPDGTIAPLLNATLVYVLDWPDETCVPTGGVPGASRTPVSEPCEMLSYIDAITGNGLFAVSGPPG